MERVFRVTTFWTSDSRRGGKLRVVTLWLSMLGMAPVADTATGMTTCLFSCHCCLISNANSWHHNNNNNNNNNNNKLFLSYLAVLKVVNYSAFPMCDGSKIVFMFLHQTNSI
jgi:hypothetical protein